LRLDGNDVVVIGEFTGLGRETQVGDRGDLEVWDFKALSPFAFRLVLEFKAEELFLEVRETGFGRDLGIANSTGLVAVSIQRAR
jgi:hypothetical protein